MSRKSPQCRLIFWLIIPPLTLTEVPDCIPNNDALYQFPRPDNFHVIFTISQYNPFPRPSLNFITFPHFPGYPVNNFIHKLNAHVFQSTQWLVHLLTTNCPNSLTYGNARSNICSLFDWFVFCSTPVKGLTFD